MQTRRSALAFVVACFLLIGIGISSAYAVPVQLNITYGLFTDADGSTASVEGDIWVDIYPGNGYFTDFPPVMAYLDLDGYEDLHLGGEYDPLDINAGWDENEVAVLLYVYPNPTSESFSIEKAPANNNSPVAVNATTIATTPPPKKALTKTYMK